jgi:hypothetical protein
MDSEDLHAIKNKIESDITHLLREFEDATGFSIEEIEIDRVETTNLSNLRRRFLTSSVRASIIDGLTRVKRVVTKIT